MKNILKKLRLKNLSISLHGLLILELLSVYPNKIFAKDFDKNKLNEVSIYYDQLESNKDRYYSKISNATSISKSEIVRDLKANGIEVNIS